MKPEEAIDYLQDPIGKREKHDEAIQMAIKALKAQLSNTSEIPNGSDTISRQGAINAIIGLPTWYYDSDRHYGDPQPPMEALLDPEDVVNAIENLQPAKQEQKAGRWIPCSEQLPEKSGQYYVSGGGKVWICKFLTIPNFAGGWCNNVSNPAVQAWTPLPEEPYKLES